MKIEGFKEGQVEKRGVGRETTFTIENSAYAFRVLSESLYSHKVQSVIRELSTNAADEHVTAGREDMPFDVHLPTMFENWFSIRDFGAGLSEEDATTLYTTFFKSTKRDSNEVTGCLGLGSKSPFAVTDSFTVTSWHGGRKSVYTCYKEEGLPKLAKLSDEESSEPTGVEVMFGVAHSHYEWRIEASRVYKFFRVKPRINIDGIETSLGAVKLQGEGWSIHEGLTSCFAVMGNVAYPIDFRAIKTGEDLRDAELCAAMVYSEGLVLRYPLGAISFDPSRERLEYTKKTCETLVSTLRSMRGEVTAMLQTRVDAAQDVFHARRAFVSVRKSIFELFNDQSGAGFCKEFAEMVPMFRGAELFEGGKVTAKNRKVVAPVSSTHFAHVHRRGKDAVSIGSPLSTVYDYESREKFFVCDDRKGMSGRLRRHCIETRQECVLMTRQDAADFCLRIGMEGDLSELFSEASELPKAVRGTGSGAPSMRLWGARIDSSGSLTDKVQCTIGDEEAFYLIRTKNGFKLFEGSERYVDDSQLTSLIRKVRGIGGSVPEEVVTISDSECRRKKLSQRDNLTNLVEDLLNQLHDHVRDNIGELCSAVDSFWRCQSMRTGGGIHRMVGNASLVAKDLQHDHPLSRLARAFEGRSGRGYVASLLTESQRALISIVDHTYVSRLTNDCRYEESLFEVTAGSGSGSEVTKCAEAFPGVVHTNVDELYGMVDFTCVTAYWHGSTAHTDTIAVLRAMHEDAEMPEAVITESRSIDRLTVRSVVDENFNVESEVSSDRAA